MHKFLSLSLLSSLFFTAQYLHTGDNGFNPHDKSKLEFYCCTTRYPWDVVNLISGRYFTSIDQKTHDEFSNSFKFSVSNMLTARNEFFTQQNKRTNITGEFFFHIAEIDPASHFTDLEHLKIPDQDKRKRFLQFKKFRATTVNNKPIKTYINLLEQLPVGDAICILMFDRNLTLTVEPCEPNPTGKVASLDLSI